MSWRDRVPGAKKESLVFEDWKPIPQLPGYELSTKGRVRRTSYLQVHKGWFMFHQKGQQVSLKASKLFESIFPSLENPFKD